MAKCKDCIHFDVCAPHTEPNESYPEVGGCPAFKSKDDFVKVVRCKDCKAFVRNEGVDTNLGDCYRYGIGCIRIMSIDDFCSKGERREGE